MKYIPDRSHLEESDSSGHGLKLGIVRLGRAAGKVCSVVHAKVADRPLSLLAKCVALMKYPLSMMGPFEGTIPPLTFFF